MSGGRRAVVLLAALMALAPAVARADGDPASDVLLKERVFYPYNTKLPAASTKALAETLARAREQGYPIRVAIIANEFDLGSAALLYRKPQVYAKFLAQELALFHSEWLLIVMPNGYGIYHCVPVKREGGYSDPCEKERPAGADRRLLASLPTKERSGQDWAALSEVAVRRLAESHGASFGSGLLLGLIGAAALLAAGGGAVLVLRARRSRRRT